MSCAGDSQELVLHLGPPVDAIGGMAAVVGQIQRLDFHGRYRMVIHPNTSAPDAPESMAAKLLRHVIQLGSLRRLLRTQPIRLVHLHTCSGFSFHRSMLDALLARVMKRRVILHLHGATFDEFHAGSPRWGRWLIRRGLESVDVVVALSATWREKLLSMAPRAKVCVIENAVDVSDSSSIDTAIARSRPSDDTRCHFLLLARMDAWKGIDDLLDASAVLKARDVPFSLTLAGPAGTAGDARRLDQKIHERHLHPFVEYVGEVRGHAKEQLLRRADAYVQPSHHEGMPIAVLEALAFGLPVIATRVGAMPEIITSGREGLLTRPRNPEELAGAMERLARDATTRATMSDAARRLARDRFSLQRLRDELTQLYDAVIMKARSSSDAEHVRRVTVKDDRWPSRGHATVDPRSV